jgi:hypothetical protein
MESPNAAAERQSAEHNMSIEERCFPVYDDLWAAGKIPPINAHLDEDAIHDFREATWDRNLTDVIWPVIGRTREIGTFESIIQVDFSNHSSTTWNPFPGAETCFAERGQSLAIKCNFMLGYNSIFNLATSRCEDPSWVYDAYVEGLNNYLIYFTIPELISSIGKPKQFLQTFVVEWTRFKMVCTTLNGCFRYLDTYYVETSLIPMLVEASYNAFKKLVYNRFRLAILNSLQKLEVSNLNPSESCDREFDLTVQTLCEIDQKTTNVITRGFFFNNDSRWLKTSSTVRSALADFVDVSVDDIHGIILSYIGLNDETKSDDNNNSSIMLQPAPAQDDYFSVGESLGLRRVHGSPFTCKVLGIVKDPEDQNDFCLKISIRSTEVLISRHSYRLEPLVPDNNAE